MSEKARLLKTLFENKNFKLKNVKFCRPDGSKAVSEEEFSTRVNAMVFAIDTGLSKGSPTFDGDSDNSVDVRVIASRLA